MIEPRRELNFPWLDVTTLLAHFHELHKKLSTGSGTSAAVWLARVPAYDRSLNLLRQIGSRSCESVPFPEFNHFHSVVTFYDHD